MTAKAPPDELGGTTELAKALGVSRPRVAALAELEGFPAPVSDLPGRRAWKVREVRDWYDARIAAWEASGRVRAGDAVKAGTRD
jgi:predicted DNA-binding transcriptional regulator AlpA